MASTNIPRPTYVDLMLLYDAEPCFVGKASTNTLSSSIAIFEQIVDDEILTASAIGAIAIFLTLILVFAASKLVGKSMADMFR